MNKSIVFLCFIITLSLHLVVFVNYKNNQLIASKPSINSPLLLQLSNVKEIQKTSEISKIVETPQIIENIITTPLPKVIKPKIEKKKEIIKEKTIKETIKKEAFEKNEIKDQKTSLQNPTKDIQETNEPVLNSINSSSSQIPKENTDKNSKDLEKEIAQYINAYAAKLRQEINKNKNYPTISKRLKEEGSVIISFRVLKTGLFTNIKVISSSNQQRLDKAALNALYDTKEYKAFNKELVNKDFLDFELPLEFKLY